MFLKRDKLETDNFVIKKSGWERKILRRNFNISRYNQKCLTSFSRQPNTNFGTFENVLLLHFRTFQAFLNFSVQKLTFQQRTRVPNLTDMSTKNVSFILDGSPQNIGFFVKKRCMFSSEIQEWAKVFFARLIC